MATCKRLKVILCQLPHLDIWRQTKGKAGNIPLAAGYLKAMAHKQGLLDRVNIEILEPVHNDSDGEARLVNVIVSKNPDILGFSLYPWNATRSLFVAGEVKRLLPGIKVIAGGPEVTDESAYVLSSPSVDISVFGEGEVPFADLLKFFLDGRPDLREIGGISYKENGNIVVSRPPIRLNDLDEIPSPYLLGFIDPARYGKMMIETVRGCPYRCKYCSAYKRSSAKKPFFSAERIERELSLARDKGVKLIDLHDAAFNISPKFKEIARAIKKINYDKSMAFGVELMAELVDEGVANLLEDCNVKYCEIGLQSTNPDVLANIGRAINLNRFLKGVKLLKDKGIRLSINIIIGLPGDTLGSFRRTVDFLIKNRLLSDVIFPTVLSVGPATIIRKEAARFGLRYQPEPPYRVIETDTLSYGEIRAALNLCMKLFFKDRSRFFAYPSAASYVRKKFSARAAGDINPVKLTKPKKRISDYPVTKIVLELNNRSLSSRKMRRLGEDLSARIANVVTLWFKCADLNKGAGPIKNFLSAISRENPYTIWNILLEPGYGFPLSLMQEIRGAVFYKINNLDYDNFFLAEKPIGFSRQAARVFVIMDSGLRGSNDNWFRRLNRLAPVIWRTGFKKGSGLEDKVESLFEKKGSGLLIDFYALDLNFIFRILKLLQSKNRTCRKVILFENLLLQQLWTIALQKTAISLAEKEHIVSFGRDSGLDSSIILRGRDILRDTIGLFAAFRDFRKQN